MKIVTLQASPHLDGNTDRLLDWSERALKDWRHDVTRINLGAMNIQPCKACFACAETPDAPGCVLSDDVPGVFGEMINADAIIYATPLYMWGFSAQMKALLDRSICLVRGYSGEEHRSLIENTPATLLVSCGGPDAGNADLIRESFPRYANYARLDDRGIFVFPHCTDVNMLPNSHGATARELARVLTE